MTVLLSFDDVASEVSFPPETTRLCSAIEDFAASLTATHPCLFSRAPRCDSEDVAALLHMSLDQCRHLLAAYQSLVSTNASPGVDEGKDGDDEPPMDDDIPF
jgi:hypothetical protein